MIERAEKNGLTGQHLNELKRIVKNHDEIFRVAQSSGLAADFSPLKIELCNPHEPVRVKLRKYSAAQEYFLSRFVSALEEKGLV